MRKLMLAIAFLASPVEAQQRSCAAREVVVQRLVERYDETLAGIGLYSPVSMFEVWSSEEGTWTIILSKADGTSCIMASGTHWQQKVIIIEPEGEIQ